MKRWSSAVTFAAIVGLVPAGAAAVTELLSTPLKGGEGGLVCSCVNLTDDSIVVDFSLRQNGSVLFCSGVSVVAGNANSCTKASQGVRSCGVSREDGKPVSTSQLACNLTSLDAAGNPIVVVPVDQKRK